MIPGLAKGAIKKYGDEIICRIKLFLADFDIDLLDSFQIPVITEV